MGLTIGIDIGGTFTDVVALDGEGKVATFTKVPSVPADPSKAVMNGLERILELSRASFEDLDRVVHSSTVSLNAIIERKGARMGVLCSSGFEDLLIMGRQKRHDMYDLFADPETPQFLCPRRSIIGAAERMSEKGEVLQALDEKTLVASVGRLVEEERIEAMAVCFLFSYLNPSHELRARDVLHEAFPSLELSISSEVDPQMREYERLLMTSFDAYLKPVARRYLTNLASSLRAKAPNAQLQIMQSRGGIMGWKQAADKPVSIALSGPSAGVIGGSHAGASGGFGDLITVDIGGTSCDIAIVTEGKPLIATEGKLDRFPVRQQMIDVSCIGAGGGSLAWLDDAGALRVGPQSAGSYPGPACYARGGEEPAITDASVYLGYLNPGDFGCGGLALHPQLAQVALEKVAAKAGISIDELALGMHRILNAKMTDAIKVASVHRGFDPRKFVLVGLGGAGPVHAGALAAMLGCEKALIPQLPGVLCANGLLAADIEHEQSRTFLCDSQQADPQEMEHAFQHLVDKCAERMSQDDINPAQAAVARTVDARYAGQSYDLQIDVPPGAISSETVRELAKRFHDAHERVYGHAQRAQKVRFVAVRAVLSYKVANPKFGDTARGTPRDARKPDRRVLFDLSRGFEMTPVYDRHLLGPGISVQGPAILEQPDTTTLVYPGQVATVDAVGNVIIQKAGTKP